MSKQMEPALEGSSESVDTRSLNQQLGSAQELTTLNSVACSHYLTKIHSLPALREFLLRYADEVLGPAEFSAIYKAQTMAQQGHVQELLALDKQLASDPGLKEFAAASRAVGKRQLNRMRSLKDLRVVQRYMQAVNAGEAYGWHTLVYGVVLATYSIPVRQGLLHYGRQTLGAFVESAARALDLSDESCLGLQLELGQAVRPHVEKIIAANGVGIMLLK